ncbi:MULTISPECIES: hypothetical protein [Nocardiaceae]|uniref:Uncharacterized protein n=1 Tax=Rhodococcoides corynebacterioides TaxID=53972 RepID=A0ABS2KVK8_9NOCA|nr:MULTISPECIES: hypothetical protein [Rhodococcus]MBM7415957.1 hypothetical protein [Rhodococcus corynebacterioides]MBP1114210.1 hypothetical protein [Rhodococcus sp. PvP016]
MSVTVSSPPDTEAVLPPTDLDVPSATNAPAGGGGGVVVVTGAVVVGAVVVGAAVVAEVVGVGSVVEPGVVVGEMVVVEVVVEVAVVVAASVLEVLEVLEVLGPSVVAASGGDARRAAEAAELVDPLVTQLVITVVELTVRVNDCVDLHSKKVDCNVTVQLVNRFKSDSGGVVEVVLESKVCTTGVPTVGV